jgi:hypothetical protein
MFCLNVNAQDFTINTGDEFETPGVVWYKSNIESDSTGFYFMRNKNGIAKTYIYHKIDRNGKTIYLKETTFPTNGNVFNCNGKLLFFSFDDNSGNSFKTKNKISLYLTEVDSKTGEKISETQEVDYVETANNKQGADIDISFSPDKKMLLITSEIKENKQKQKVICRLYSTNGYKRIWEKEPITSYKNSTVSSSQYSVDNQGNLYYTFGYIRSGLKNEFDQYIDVNYGIVSASGSNATVIIKEINAVNKKIETLTSEIIGNKFICTGNFSDGEIDIDKNAKRGFFMASLQQADNPYTENFVYIEDAIEADIKPRRKESGNTIYWKPAKVFLIGNSYYAFRQVVRVLGYSTLDEILLIKYSADMKYQWMKEVRRLAYGEKESSVNLIINDKINLIYYENLQNIENAKGTEKKKLFYAAYDKDPIVITSINDQGTITQKVLPINNQILLEDQSFKDYHGHYLNSLILPVRISNKKKRYDVLIIK